MASLGPITTRTTSLLASDNLLRSLQRTQLELFNAQNQIGTGKSVNTPSESPSKASSILFLQQQVQAREQWDQNLQHALGTLNNVDASLAGATDILLETQSIASSQIGIGSDEQTRQIEAEVIDAQLQALLGIANRQFNDLSLFGGNNGPDANGLVFEEFLGGIRYIGTRDSLRAEVGTLSPQVLNSNGFDAFGALSSRVQSSVDLAVQASAGTRLADVGGARNLGVAGGSISLTVNATQVTVDLTTIDTLGDVATRINDAINNISAGAGSMTVAGEGFTLTAAGGNTITLGDIGAGQTAADLGINLTVTGGGIAGPSVNPRLTETTLLGDFATTVDFANGLLITQGEQTKVADFSGATNVQGLINAIDALQLGLRMEINAQGTGLDLVSEVSGVALSVGENGGTTAQDLGLTTLGLDTKLSDFRFGLGVEPVEAADDIQFTTSSGATFGVDAGGVETVDDLINAIYAAAGTVGLTGGVDIVVAPVSTGNGLVFTDNTGGAGVFTIEDAGLSLVATQLGIAGNAGAGNTITSENNSRVKVDSVFTHLMDLRESLINNDERGITLAGQNVEQQIDRVVRARASVGVEAARMEQQQQRSADLEIAEKAMLSELQDADLTEVITKFSQLQTQLQASLQAAAQNLQLSLLDFLR